MHLNLNGIDSIEEAEKYKSMYIKIDREDAVELPKGSYFIVDLIGLEVKTEEGEVLGEVYDIYPTGSNDIYVVKNKITGEQILLPAVKEVIKNVDIQNKTITVKLMEGLV